LTGVSAGITEVGLQSKRAEIIRASP
jgi:hypothetical protein